MKKLLLLTAGVFTFMLLFSQKNKKKTDENSLPSFGNIAKSELEMKECSFDPKAEAMVLFDKGELTCIIGPSFVDIEMERHVRIKIFSKKGLDLANIHLRYHSYRNDEDIKDISAQTYNLDASGNMIASKVEKKLIYEKALNKRYSEKVFTFPEVRAGSIIEYKYKITGVGIVNWYFQRAIPVSISQFTLDFPKEIEVASVAKCSRNYETNTDQSPSRTKKYFAMKEVPALRDELYIINEDDYLERIESRPVALYLSGRRTSITTTWPRIVKELMEDEDFGIQLKKEIPRTADLDESLKKLSDPFLKMKTIYNYVKDKMEWNGYTSIWALDGVKSAWKDKKGTAGEINLILVNLLRDADLKAKPILVSTHDNGLINTLQPGYSQFDKVLAYVVIDKKEYILDATDKDNPVNLIPPDVILTEGLVIEKYETFEWGWKTLWDETRQYKNLILINGTVEKNGKLTGEANIYSYDYARLSRIKTAKKGKKEFAEQYFSATNPGITIDSISIQNTDTDSLPLQQSVFFNQQLNSSGDYLYFSANIFTGLETNPFIADTRFSDVFFGTKQHHSIVGNFAIPEGYEFEELPKNTKMIMPDTSISILRLSSINDNMLSLRISLEFKKPFYSIDEYLKLQGFYKKMQDILDEQYVVRRKKN